MEEILAALDEDYSIEISYTAPDEDKTKRIRYSTNNPPPDRYACPVRACKGGGFDLKDILGHMVRPRRAALDNGTWQNHFIDDERHEHCIGREHRLGQDFQPCMKGITIHLKATLREPVASNPS